jgi:hypothetical protein
MSQFKLQDMMPEDIAAIVTKGIGSDFENLIYTELKAQAEAVAKKVAKEIADRLAAQVTGYRASDTFQNRIDLHFNMLSMDSDPVGHVVDSRDGIPVVAWNGDTRDLVGKKIFIAK